MARNPVNFIWGATVILTLAYGANLVTVFMYFPTGMYSTLWVEGDTYLMGFDNAMIYNLIPLCVYALLWSLMSKGKLLGPSSVMALGISVVSVYYVQSVSGIVELAIFGMTLLAAIFGWVRPHARSVLLVGWFAIATIVVFIDQINFVPDSVFAYFGKDATLTGRTVLWHYAVEGFLSSPATGVGVGRAVLGRDGHVYPHAHSMVADTLYTSGLLGIIALGVVVLALARTFGRAGSDTLATSIVFAGVLAFLVGETANSAQFKALFWATMALAAHAPTIRAGCTRARPAAHDGSKGLRSQ
jgi:O-antigen ligase